MVGMKNVVLVADAKCIHYSVEPINYAEAWGRLEEGCEQAIRKALFIRNHHEHFLALGDFSNKRSHALFSPCFNDHSINSANVK